MPDDATPRTILYTGKGGVGKTSVAAATARRCAHAGLRTIVISTDPAHSLSDALGVRLGADPIPIIKNLDGQEVQANAAMERNWSAVREWLSDLLHDRGVDQIAAEELTVPPGMDELFSLLELKTHHESGKYDLIIVDCAPTGETLRLLSFPDVARWWLEKVFPWEKRLMSMARPFAKGLLDLPLPSGDVYDDIERLMTNLIAMNEILRDRRHASVRLVMNPDKMVVNEAMRTYTYLNLYGFVTDAVVVNRVFPPEVDGGYFGAWREAQSEQLAQVRSGFEPVPVLVAPYFDREVIGPKMLDRLGDAVFASASAPAQAMMYDELAQEFTGGDGAATLRLKLPFAARGEISLKKIGAEVVVRVADQKRTIVLPQSLAGYRAREAKFEGGSLRVEFEEAPE